uniref:(northern house mosquito) hypothetical protein n=1 Tax=Culex pipiens TaxID=7175 RepID=A0A8D8I184_CULPI
MPKPAMELPVCTFLFTIGPKSEATSLPPREKSTSPAWPTFPTSPNGQNKRLAAERKSHPPPRRWKNQLAAPEKLSPSPRRPAKKNWVTHPRATRRAFYAKLLSSPRGGFMFLNYTKRCADKLWQGDNPSNGHGGKRFNLFLFSLYGQLKRSERARHLAIGSDVTTLGDDRGGSASRPG